MPLFGMEKDALGFIFLGGPRNPDSPVQFIWKV